MMMDENARCWYILCTAPRLERKLMQLLTVAGFKTYCPMQTIYINWNGKMKEFVVPFFSGCVFCRRRFEGYSSCCSISESRFLVDTDGKELSIVSNKANLLSKFAQLLK